MPTSLGDLLASRARLSPQAIGFAEDGRSVTFAQFDARCDRLARWFRARGVAPGDRVALLVKNTIDAAIAFFAASRAGAVAVTLNHRLTNDELVFILGDCGARALAYDASFAGPVEILHAAQPFETVLSLGASDRHDTLAAALAQEEDGSPPLPAQGEDDVAVIMYTSGTTGHPKGAMLTHRNLMFSALSTSSTIEWTMRDRFLLVTPLFHIAGVVPLVTGVMQGSLLRLMADFDPAAAWAVIGDERITSSMLVPVMLTALLASKAARRGDASSIRSVSCGASVVPAQLIDAWRREGVVVMQVYGLTEFTGSVSYWMPSMGEDRSHSHGRPAFLVDLRIADLDTGDAVPAGMPGEILCRSPTIFAGYWNNPAATAATLRDGWLATGDIGYLDEDGFLYVVDRRKDMIVSGGENVYPAEVEQVIRSLPGVIDVAVVGRHDERWGEALVAFVVTGAGATGDAAAIVAECRRRLAGFKCPREVRFLDEMPRNGTGKIVKPRLRELAAA